MILKKKRKKRASSGVIVKAFEKHKKLGIGKELHKRELEWEQRRDKERENQLDDSVIVEG